MLTPERRAELREKLRRRSGSTVLVPYLNLTALLDAADEAENGAERRRQDDPSGVVGLHAEAEEAMTKLT